MARMRTIKPGFFKNESLADLPPLTRLLFAGLWTEADREGRLEDRPRRLKVELLPYDDCDTEAMLTDLASAGFIRRYAVDGVRLIAILKFKQHQSPNIKEGASTLPPPPEPEESTVLAPCGHGVGTCSCARHGEQEQEHESLSVVPSGTTSSAEPSSDVPPPDKPARDRVPIGAMIDGYNAHRGPLPSVVAAGKREAGLRATWPAILAAQRKSGSTDPPLEVWHRMVTLAAADRFYAEHRYDLGTIIAKRDRWIDAALSQPNGNGHYTDPAEYGL